MIGGGYLIYIFPEIHFEPNFFPPLTLNRFLSSSRVYRYEVITKICAEFNNA
jgi:hypothetical protein